MFSRLFPALCATALALPVLSGAALADPLIGVTSATVAAPETGAEEGQGERPLSLTLWYPATGGTAAPETGNAVFRGPDAVRDGTPVAGPLPLVLVSHGGLRSAADSGAWLAAGLAAQGMIAVEVSAPRPASAEAALDEIWRRPQDLSDALTALLNDPQFSGYIDTSRIGAVGFALGGTAVARLAGAEIDAPGYAAACDPGAEDAGNGPDCGWFAGQGVSLAATDPARLAASQADPRITAALAIAPEYAGLLTLPQGAAPLTVLGLGALPAQVAGAGDPTLLPGATPMDAFALCTPKGAAILAEDDGDPAICGNDSAARQAVHDRIVALAAQALKPQS